MNKISKLLNDISDFYKRSWSAYTLIKSAQAGYSSYDPEEDLEEDAGKYDDMIELSHRVDDSGMASELALLAEMYKKAITLGVGYNSIYRAISNFMNMYLDDEDDDQLSNIEDVLNDVVKDLRTRAGGASALAKPDSPEVIRQLKEIKDQYNQKTLQDEVAGLSKYDEATDDLTQFEETAVPTFDPTGGVGKEEADKSGRGYGVITKRAPKDWIVSYENEKMRFADALPAAANEVVRGKIKKLIEILDKLKYNTAAELALIDTLSVAPDEEAAAKLAVAREENKKLKKERRSLRASIRDTELNKHINKLEEEVKSVRDPKDQFRLKQEIELYKTLASKDLNKSEETNRRRILIKSMSGGNMPGPETLKKMLDGIAEAAKKKMPIEEYRKQLAIKKREKIQKGIEPRMVGQVGTLDGLIADLSTRIANHKMAIKKTITDPIKAKLLSEQHTKFQPFLDRIAEAKSKGDAAAIKNISKELNNAMQMVEINAQAELHPKLKSYIEQSNLAYAFQKKVKMLDSAKVIESNEPLPEVVRGAIAALIGEGKALVQQFRERTSIALTLKDIVSLLEKRISQ